MKTISIFILLLVLSLNSFGQSDADCTEILSRQMDLSKDYESPIQTKDFQIFNECFLDSIDRHLIYQTPILSFFVIESEQSDAEFTFKDFLDFYNDFKKSPEYLTFREIQELNLRLSKMKLSLENWEEVKNEIITLGASKADVAALDKAIREKKYTNYTYEQFFKEVLNETNETSGIEPPAISSQSNLSTIIADKDFDFDSLIKQAKEENKQLLLFFTGHGAVNAQKMEEFVLSNDYIKERLDEKFLYVKLFIDDRTKLEEEIKTKDGKTLRTIGNKFSYFQTTKFQNISQPYFVIIDENGNKLRDIGYVYFAEFVEFLEN